MKRKLLLGLCLIAMSIASVFLFVGCGDIQLQSPENIKYDGMTITWNAVGDAESYSVQINDGDLYQITDNKLSYVATESEFSVKIKALSGISGFIDSDEAIKQFKSLGKIEELRVAEDGTVSWDAVTSVGSIYYEVKVDNVVKISDLAMTSYSEVGAGNHSVTVRPVVKGNTDYYSVWATPVNVNILAQISKASITYNNDTNKITWSAVYGAQFYELSVNGLVQISNSTAASYEYDAHNENFEVQIRAIGNHSTTYDGKISEVKKFVFLATVTNVNVVDGILVWDDVAGADGYKVKLGSYIKEEQEARCDKLTAGVSTDVSIMPTSSDTAYFSDWSATKNVYILKTPNVNWQGVNESGEPFNSITWNLDDHDAGYTVKLTLPSGHQTEYHIGQNVQVFGEDDGVAFTEIGSYKIEVKANAQEGSSTYDSKYSAPITVTRLAAPTWVAKDFITSNKEQISEGFTATFNKVAGASNYNLYIGNEGKNLKKTTTGTQFVVKDVSDEFKDEQNGGTLTYKIQSIGNGSGVTQGGQLNVILNSLDTLTFEITVLPTPQVEQKSFSGMNFVYGSVNKNNGYGILIDGKVQYSNDTSYDLSAMSAGEHTVQVCTEGNGHEILPSNYSELKNVYRFSAPYNIKMSGQLITFSSDNNYNGYEVDGYTIQYNHSSEEENVELNDNIYEKISTAGTAIAIKANVSKYTTNGTYLMSSNWSQEDTFFTKLQAPTFGDVIFTDTEFHWNTPSNAGTWKQKYVVGKGTSGTLWNDGVTSTSMDITSIPWVDEGHKFAVKAVGDGVKYIDSEWSEVKSIYKLATPTLSYSNGENGGYYTWSAGEAGNSYSLYIDNVLQCNEPYQGGKTYTFKPTFNGNKTKRVELYAVGDGGTTTIKSNPYVIEQTIGQLSNPTISVKYSEDSYSTTGTIDVKITKKAEFGSSGIVCESTQYSYSVGNATVETYDLEYSKLPTSRGAISVKAYALGGVFDDNGVYYLASKEAAYEDEVTSVTLLNKVDLSKATVSGGGLLRLNTTSGSNYGFEMQISINGGEYDDIPLAASATSYQLANFADINILRIKVRAKGNGKNVITSEWSEREMVVVH